MPEIQSFELFVSSSFGANLAHVLVIGWKVASSMPYESAPFLRRLGARLLDLVFCYALALILAVPVALILFLPIIVFMDEVPDIMPSVGAIICLFLAYVGTEGFLLVRREGQTLGKGLLGLRVIPVGSSRLSLLSALVRLAVILSPFVFMSLAGSFKDNAVLDLIASIGAISLFVSLVLTVIPPAGSRRTLHDFAASTRVVRAVKRKIDIKHDLKLVLPGRVDMTKHV